MRPREWKRADVICIARQRRTSFGSKRRRRISPITLSGYLHEFGERHGCLCSDRAALTGGAQVGEHGLVPARGFEAARLVVEALGGGEAGMAEHVAGIAHMLGVLDGDCGGGGIAEPMWR